MTVEKILPVIEGVNDIEEIKTNLSLIGAEWHSRACGRSEIVIVTCDEGKFRIRKNGSLEKYTAELKKGAM